MSIATPIVTNLTGGEWSPRLYGRVDQELYYTAATTLENAIVFPHGGAVRRSGKRFVGEVKNSSSNVRLLPFEYSDDQTFVLEFGEDQQGLGYMRIFHDEGRVVESELVSNGTFATNLTGWDDLASGGGSISWTASNGGMMLLAPNSGWGQQDVAVTSNSGYVFSFDAVYGDLRVDVGLTSGGGEVLSNASYCEGSHSVEFYVPSGASTVYIQFRNPSSNAARAVDNVSLSRIYEIQTPWTSDQVGSIKYAQGYDTMYVTHPNVQPQVVYRNAATDWVCSNASFTGAPARWTGTNWPSCVGFFEQRTVWGGDPSSPHTLNFSKSADLLNLTTGTADDDGFELPLMADSVSAIKSFLNMPRLLVFTSGGEWSVGAGVSNEPLTPTNVTPLRESKEKSANIQAVLVSSTGIFVQQSGKAVLQIGYSWEDDGYKPEDITLLAEHVTGPGLTDLTYAMQPDRIIWACRSDGQLIGCTFLRAQKVIGWHRHPDGGDGEIESLASVYNRTIAQDQLWCVVKRTINGATRRYVEFMEETFSGTDTGDGFFVDSGLTYDGDPTDTITNLEHLEGETVQVLADGGVHPDRVVKNGTIKLARSFSKVHVGLGYTTTIKPMRVEAGSHRGTAQGKIKGIPSVTVRFYETLGCKVGPDEDHLDEYWWRSSARNMGESLPAQNADIVKQISGGFNRDGYVTIVQDQPLPMTVLAIIPEVVIYE